MKTLVLGATGQLGSNLVRALLDNGDQVRALIRPASRAHTVEGLPLERIEGDLNDPGSLAGACEGVDIVYHAAGYYPAQTIPAAAAIRLALNETNHVLNAVREAKVDRLVFVSTLTTIGFPNDPQHLADESCRFRTRYTRNPYLMSKAAMEDAVLGATREGIPAVVVNPTAFFGPYDSKPTSGTQILMIARRLMPGYVQGLTNVIDVRDVAVGMMRAAQRGRIGERYILGNWNTTQKELNELIAGIAGVMAPLIRIPFTIARYGSRLGDWACRNILRRAAPVPGFFVEMLRHMQHYDCSKAIRELEYPRNPVELAIRDALTWFRQNGYLRA